MVLRIALVSSSYHPYVGGVESHVRHVAKELVQLGHEVEVWTVDRGENLATRYVDGVLVRYLPTPMPARSVGAVTRFAVAFPPAWRAWRRAFRSFQPEVLHVQCFGPNGVYAAGLGRRTHTPFVVSSHGETFADDHGVFDESALMRRGLAGALRRASLVTGCSRLVAEDLATRFGATHTTVVPNGVELDASWSLAQQDDRETGLVLGVGRLEHNKGFDLLIRALALSATGTSTKLLLVGEGSERSALTQLATELGVADRVTLAGAQSAEQVADSMARASVVVVPSRREAFGIVVLEAWRSGAPVVVTSRGGPASFVTDGVDGLVVDPEDLRALSAAIGRIVGEAGLAARLARAGRQTVSQYTWARTASTYEGMYQSLLKR